MSTSAAGATAAPPVRVRAALASARQRLRQARLDDAGLIAEALLAHVLGRDRVWLYAHPESVLPQDALRRLASLVSRAATQEPLAYLIGEREFLGRSFLVRPGVLVPRPETELLVEVALDILTATAPRVADVGCGSGVIAISVALARPEARIVALDLDAQAVRLTRLNVQRLGARSVIAVQADLLAPVRGPLDAVLANLPYVATRDLRRLSRPVRQEPRQALAGGHDGLDVYRRFLPQVPAVLPTGGICVFEIGAGQAAAACALARATFPEARVRTVRDYAGHERVVVLER